METQSISLLQVLQVGGLAGIISAIISAGVKEFFDSKERIRKAQYLALRISLILENYYHLCVDRIYELTDYVESRGSIGSNKSGLPQIGDYPQEPNTWIYLNQEIVDEILSFPAIIDAMNESIDFNATVIWNPDGQDPDLTIGPLYEIAPRAIRLARLVRSKHRLQQTSRTDESEVRLQENKKRFLDRSEPSKGALDLL